MIAIFCYVTGCAGRSGGIILDAIFSFRSAGMCQRHILAPYAAPGSSDLMSVHEKRKIRITTVSYAHIQHWIAQHSVAFQNTVCPARLTDEKAPEKPSCLPVPVPHPQ